MYLLHVPYSLINDCLSQVADLFENLDDAHQDVSRLKWEVVRALQIADCVRFFAPSGIRRVVAERPQQPCVGS